MGERIGGREDRVVPKLFPVVTFQERLEDNFDTFAGMSPQKPFD